MNFCTQSLGIHAVVALTHVRTDTIHTANGCAVCSKLYAHLSLLEVCSPYSHLYRVPRASNVAIVLRHRRTSRPEGSGTRGVA